MGSLFSRVKANISAVEYSFLFAVTPLVALAIQRIFFSHIKGNKQVKYLAVIIFIVNLIVEMFMIGPLVRYKKCPPSTTKTGQSSSNNMNYGIALQDSFFPSFAPSILGATGPFALYFMDEGSEYQGEFMPIVVAAILGFVGGLISNMYLANKLCPGQKSSKSWILLLILSFFGIPI